MRRLWEQVPELRNLVQLLWLYWETVHGPDVWGFLDHKNPVINMNIKYKFKPYNNDNVLRLCWYLYGSSNHQLFLNACFQKFLFVK